MQELTKEFQESYLKSRYNFFRVSLFLIFLVGLSLQVARFFGLSGRDFSKHIQSEYFYYFLWYTAFALLMMVVSFGVRQLETVLFSLGLAFAIFLNGLMLTGLLVSPEPGLQMILHFFYSMGYSFVLGGRWLGVSTYLLQLAGCLLYVTRYDRTPSTRMHFFRFAVCLSALAAVLFYVEHWRGWLLRRVQSFVVEREVFFSTASHELRTPLTGVLHALDQLSTLDGLPGAAPQLLHFARESAAQLGNLVDDLLVLQKLTAEIGDQAGMGRRVLGECFSPCREVETVVAQLALNGRVRVKALPPRGRLCRGHARNFRLVLANLLSNAAKYAREQVELSVEEGPPFGANGQAESESEDSPLEDDMVFPPRGARGEMLRVTVADDGAGFDEARARTLLFQPFRRLEDAGGGSGGGGARGTGLGLVTVKAVASLYGGGVGLRSSPGLGSRFWATLGTAPIRALPRLLAADGATTRKVILADDNRTNLLLLARIMTAFVPKEHVLLAGNGREAVELFRAHREEVAALVLDITMPVMDGKEAMRAIRREGAPPGLIALALTAALDLSPEAGGEGWQQLFTKVLFKPVN